MFFQCLTDEEKKQIKPFGCSEEIPFYAHKNLETCFKLVSAWANNQSAFPVNPRLPFLPEMPKTPHPFATFLYTSGSSALPKIACLTLDNYLASAEGSNEAVNLTQEDRWLLSLPLFHVGGIAILFRCFLAKACVVISELNLLDALLHHKITHLSLVPTQLYRLLQEDPKKLEQCAVHLKMILLGGSPIPQKLSEKALEFGLPLHVTYGLTEMASQVTMDTIPGALRHREVKISEEGEILVRGKTLFSGYQGMSLELDHEGWFATKDLGCWSPEGILRVLGRRDNLFISGGENIQPEEIESALLNLPGIKEALVVPKEDPEFGKRPFAFITEENNIKNNFKLIQEKLKEKLPSHKIPIRIFPLKEEVFGLKRSRKELTELAQKID